MPLHTSTDVRQVGLDEPELRIHFIYFDQIWKDRLSERASLRRTSHRVRQAHESWAAYMQANLNRQEMGVNMAEQGGSEACFYITR